jgi:hydrogenase expression/formation protein HypE
LVTKGVGLEGTAILASDFAEVALGLGLSKETLETARSLGEQVSVLPEALALADNGATSMHDVTRGGLLETLSELSMLSQVRFEVEVEQIPLPPVVARFAEAFEFDPVRMISSGTLVATVPPKHVRAAMRAVEGQGVEIFAIGRVTEGHGVCMRGKEGTRVIEAPAPEEDELARMWQRYPRDQ